MASWTAVADPIFLSGLGFPNPASGLGLPGDARDADIMLSLPLLAIVSTFFRIFGVKRKYRYFLQAKFRPMKRGRNVS